MIAFVVRAKHKPYHDDSMESKRAFTLIEMLVVISILALLIALLLPSLQKARQVARQVQCASNMRQLTLAMNLYATDNERLPTEGTVTATGGNARLPAHPHDPRSWDDKLGAGYDGRNLSRGYQNQGFLRHVSGNAYLDPGGYTIMETLYRCPEHRSFVLPDRFPRSYAMNSGGYVDQRIDGDHPSSPNFLRGITRRVWSKAPSDVPAPASTLLLVEGDALADGGGQMGNPNLATMPSPFWQQGGPFAFTYLPFHDEQWNYAFVDGHVQLMSPHDTVGDGNYGGPSYDRRVSMPRDDRGPGGMWTVDPDD